MTSDGRAPGTAPRAPPSRSKSMTMGNGSGSGQPAMTQKSLLSFFKTTSTPAAPTEADERNDIARNENAGQDKGKDAFSAKSPLTPTKNQSSSPSSAATTSALFSTDDVLHRHAKRKTIDFEDLGPDGLGANLSPMKSEDSHAAKKFAAAVERLSLNTPVRKLRLDRLNTDDQDELSGSGAKQTTNAVANANDDDLEEDNLSFGVRRSTRSVGRVKYQQPDSGEDEDDDQGPKSPTRNVAQAQLFQSKQNAQNLRQKRRGNKDRDDSDGDSDYEAPAIVPEDDFDMDLDDADLDDALLEEEGYDAEDDIDSSSPAQNKNNSTKTKKTLSTAAPATTTIPARAPTTPALASIFGKSASRPTPTPQRPTLMLKDDKKKERLAKFEEANSGRYKWLLEIKDVQGNPIGSPDYDPRTLNIPRSAWEKFTEFERQFWEIKGQHFDSVVFFKKGKFYELYENDADIGHQQFDLKLTDRTNMRMVGVPESSFEYWAAQFIAKGYKVARVDQMETALAKAMRERDGASAKSAPKVIRRELHSILTAGTLTDSGLLTNEMATYCMAIKEVVRTGGEHLPTQFGVAFVDTATAEFNVATFYDDMDRTKFETLITQIKPREIVVEKGGLGARSTRILKNSLGVNTIWNHLHPETEFWGSLATADELRVHEYFGPNTPGTLASDCWPTALQKQKDNDAVMSALGALVWYLRSLKLDKELLSFKNFHIYDPVRQASTLILDGQTLSNLEIFQNNSDGTESGSVLKLLNRCVTPFGKRLFRRWLCHPLRSGAAINARLDAVEDLMRIPGFMELFEERCARFPDLERIVSRIHAGSCKISEFLTVLSTFRTLVDTAKRLNSFTDQFQSKKLESVLAEMPDVVPYLDYFSEAFDHEVAAAEGDIMPHPGFAEDYDDNCEVLRQLDLEFAKHLDKAKSELKVTKIVYKDLGKEIYQLEIPNKVTVPKNWKKMSGTNAVSRYYHPGLVNTITRLQEARETKGSIMRELKGRLYAKFDENYKDWLRAVKIIAELDCLGSLAKSSSALGYPACRPEFVESESSVLELEGMRHPCVIPGIASDFIPNDTNLGGSDPNLILLTGPNMGGKSTLLRQTCVAIIMAQLGCYVSAEKCRLTPFDRIFTRIGANDNILAGQSTFMVELSETSKILAEATEKSMVILDELGRGTSTFDGYAIAYSVLHELSTRIGCLGLFSTHYGTLTSEFERDPNVALKHMACQVDQNKREVTFLYKLVPGVCEKSYGMNVAHMAGVPRSIVDRAEVMAEEFELKQASKRDEEWRLLERGTKDVGQGMVMDLGFLLHLVGIQGQKNGAEGAVDKTTMEVDGGAESNGWPSGRSSQRKLTLDQETRVLQRIFKSMANV